MAEVTDPALLSQLNGSNAGGGSGEVTDPELLKQLNAPDPNSSWSGTAWDAIKGIPGAALARLSGLASAGGQAAATEMSDPELASQIPDAAQTNQLIQKNVTGPLYQSQTPIGRTVSDTAAAAFDPSSYVGPGGPIRSLASSLVSNLFSNTAGETARAMGASPGAETVARAAGGFLAPTFAGRSRVVGDMPNQEELDQAASSGFRNMRTTNASITNAGDWADNTLQHFQHPATNWTERTAPETTAILEDMATRPGTMSPADIDEVKQLLTNVRGEPAARAALSRLNDFATQDALGTGDINAFRQAWGDANGNYAAARRLEAVNDAANSAEVATQGANSAKNLGNTYKQRFRTFLTNDNAARGFQDNELNAIDAMNSGSPWVNLMRNTGNRLGGGGGIGQALIASGKLLPLAGAAGAAYGGASGNNEALGGGLGLAVLGALARRGYNNAVARQVGDIGNLVASRSPLAAARGATFTAASPRTSLLFKRLLNSAITTQQGQQ